MRHRSSLLAVLALLSGPAGPAAAQWNPPESPTTRSHSRARQILMQAVQAHGGLDAVRSLKTVYRAGTGRTYTQGQNLAPDAPPIARDLQTEAWLDFAENRTRFENRQQVAGVLAHTRNVVAGDSGYTWTAAAGVSIRMTPAQAGAVRNNLRRDPLRILATAAARPETLRSLGNETVGGRTQDVVSFADSDGATLTLYFDGETHRLSKIETWSDTPVIGDTLNEQFLSDYRPVGGLQVPFRLAVRNAGETTQEVVFQTVRVNEPLEAQAFELPRDTLDPPAGPPLQVATLAPGVFHVGGGTHHSLAVVFRDHVVVVEAPLNSDRSRAVLDRVKELAPGKPIRYVVNTHYHYDHSGGLREYVAEGITVVTQTVNADFIRRMAKLPRTIRPDRLALHPVEAKVEAVADRRVFEDGDQTLELHSVANSHVNGMLVAYLPKHKILFAADVFNPPAVGPIPAANDFNVELRNGIRKLGIQVETLAGAHGKVAAIAELDKAVAARK